MLTKGIHHRSASFESAGALLLLELRRDVQFGWMLELFAL